VIIGLGIIFGNLFATWHVARVTTDDGIDYTGLFSLPMWIAVVCLAGLLLLYPSKKPVPAVPA
jgi:hypothetical protein